MSVFNILILHLTFSVVETHKYFPLLTSPFHFSPQIYDILTGYGLSTHCLKPSLQKKVLPHGAFLCTVKHVWVVMEVMSIGTASWHLPLARTTS